MSRDQEILSGIGFVFVEAGSVNMGTKVPIDCPIEGKRINEWYRATHCVEAFWVNKYCVSNAEFEQFNPKHKRNPISSRNRDPVTDVTYHEAISYCSWLGDLYGSSFDLPTEPEWTYAGAPSGWMYPYKQGPKPYRGKANCHAEDIGKTVEVDDGRFGTNHLGLYHIVGNVQEMTKGVYRTPAGAYGSTSDGSYYIALGGGDYGHCLYATRIVSRFIHDIADRSTRLGFRLIARV